MSPTVKLKATVLPLSVVRTALLGDLMKNFGADDEQIRIAQQGFAEHLLMGVIVIGMDANGVTQDHVELDFEKLRADTTITVDTSGGRSMIEALSVKLAHAVAYSVEAMRRKGLTISFRYHFMPAVWNDLAKRHAMLARFNLMSHDDNLGYFPGTGPRLLFSVKPGADSGTRYSHFIARNVIK